jgi:hypothetical protein
MVQVDADKRVISSEDKAHSHNSGIPVPLVIIPGLGVGALSSWVIDFGKLSSYRIYQGLFPFLPIPLQLPIYPLDPRL